MGSDCISSWSLLIFLLFLTLTMVSSSPYSKNVLRIMLFSSVHYKPGTTRSTYLKTESANLNVF